MYMTRVVESIAPDYAENLIWEKVITKEKKGALRFVELSKRLGRPAPVPSIYINDQLVFEKTPMQAELKDYIDGLLAEKGV
jgi:hypothetical protein